MLAVHWGSGLGQKAELQDGMKCVMATSVASDKLLPLTVGVYLHKHSPSAECGTQCRRGNCAWEPCSPGETGCQPFLWFFAGEVSSGAAPLPLS